MRRSGLSAERVAAARSSSRPRNRGKLREVAEILAARRRAWSASTTWRPGGTSSRTARPSRPTRASRREDLARRTGPPALGDDSGLEVDALGGRPGVRSARYAGEHATDAENTALLLHELRGRPGRRARAARSAARSRSRGRMAALVEADGRCEGWIARAPRRAAASATTRLRRSRERPHVRRAPGGGEERVQPPPPRARRARSGACRALRALEARDRDGTSAGGQGAPERMDDHARRRGMCEF